MRGAAEGLQRERAGGEPVCCAAPGLMISPPQLHLLAADDSRGAPKLTTPPAILLAHTACVLPHERPCRRRDERSRLALYRMLSAAIVISQVLKNAYATTHFRQPLAPPRRSSRRCLSALLCPVLCLPTYAIFYFTASARARRQSKFMHLPFRALMPLMRHDSCFIY